ncbi:MAG: T9SS type A sorting domain-containing protein [Haliscomenobacter sp.]|nr:T9SS type A sorting domain-containing protein [Haliscomenobacter sp.]
MRTIFFLALSAWPLIGAAQAFPVAAIQKNGPDSTRINLVMLSDGYTQDQLTQYLKDAGTVADKLFQTTPFKEYKAFFNVYAISVPSVESGADHPGTATDVTEPAAPVQDVQNIFGSTFDYFNIHRLLVAKNSAAIFSTLAASFPGYDQSLVIVNSAEYGGSGGAFPTTSTHPSSAEVAIHELGHSFSFLADEYWAGDFYAGERANMTATTDTAKVKWKNWLNTQNVGIYPYGSSGLQAQWHKPVNGLCKMEYLGRPFCPVCREAIINRIYQLASPIADYAPKSATLVSDKQPMPFSVALVNPNPNTLTVQWTLNGKVIAQDQTSITLSPAQLDKPDNVLSATITDNTSLSRSYRPASGYVFFRTWTIKQQVTPVEEPVTSPFRFEVYPNPAQDIIYGQFYSPTAGETLHVSLLDLKGSLLKTQSFPLHQGAQTVSMPVHDLPPGTYVLQLRYRDWRQGMVFFRM